MTTYALRNYSTNQLLDGSISPELIAASLAEPTGTGAVRATCVSVTHERAPHRIGANGNGPRVFTGRTESVWQLDPNGLSTVYVEAVAQ